MQRVVDVLVCLAYFSVVVRTVQFLPPPPPPSPNQELNVIAEGFLNLVPRAFALEIGRGGSKPRMRL